MRFSLALLIGIRVFAQEPAQIDAGGALFQSSCSVCHGADGTGSDRGPAILNFVRVGADRQITSLIRDGRGGMPSHKIADAEMQDLLAFLRVTASRGPAVEPRKASLRLAGGGTLEGTIRAETGFETQLVTADQKLHVLVREGDVYRERVREPKQDWPSYDGGYTGNRYSALAQINTTNAAKLTASWFFPMPGTPRIESTPLVVDGIMYVTAVNEAYALDAVSGRQIWRYRQPRTDGLLGEAAGGANRGVAIAGERLFMVTDHAHLIALDKSTGRKLWDVEMADHVKEQYSATGAPLVVGDLVFAGVAGGEEGVRGFLDAYQISTGEHAWRFWTIPAPGEKNSETWKGKALEHGCGATWLTGTYDPALDLLYWSVGNPCPDYNGDERLGDNLYTSSILALKPKTGELQWYYQFTPHDTHDWDATEPMLLVDETWQGRARKLILHASRNGYFFVLDRTNGELLSATPFLKKVTWTSGYGKDGRPVMLPNSEPSLEGTLTCPASGGGTNWMSASYHPTLKLFYFQANETCGVYKKNTSAFELGKRYFGGNAAVEPGSRSFMRALDIHTGKTIWDYEILGRTQSGTLATAGGLVFFGDGAGEFTAVDARNGKRLWHFNAGQGWRASPMTFESGGKQFVVIGGAAGFFAFGLN